ncbi:hypothetical protein [Paenibacillus sp. Aloe-11]|uniref:hypothetical protein n=1 Tax=Paenibacillus sp. Aloe-11 TaxID=1050222 RepID=UPI0002EAF179|nr:hypothetical protein [Paenibacillus sp. Aloe-11]
MERMKLQKDWLDYVNRLQDRERQKIISSGITNWTLLLAVMGLAYWVYPDIAAIQKNWKTVLIGYVLFGNTATTLFDFFNSYYRQRKIKKYGSPTSSIEIKGLAILWRYQLIMLLSFLGPNVYFLFQSKNLCFILYFIIYCIRYLFEVVPTCKRIIDSHRTGKFEEYQSTDVNYEKSHPIIEVHKLHEKLLIFIIRFLFSYLIKLIMTFLITSYICLNYNFNNILWKQIFDGLVMVIIVILFQFLLAIFMKRMKIAWLENLEREIIVNNLTEDQIISKLKLGYFNASNIDNYF